MNNDRKKELFIRFLNDAQICEKTKKTYLQRLNYVLPYLSKINENEIEKFIVLKQSEGKSNSYLNKIIQLLILFQKANGRILKFKKLKEKKVTYKTLTLDQINNIIAISPPPDYYGTFFALCAYTGARPCEIASLQASNIDLVADVIEIKLDDTKTKTHERIIPIIPNLKPIIVNYLNSIDGDCLFPGIDKDKWGKQWRKRCNKLAIKAPLYSLRRSYATQGLADGVHLEEMMQLLGHSNINTTMIYYQRNMSILKKAIEKHSYNEGRSVDEIIENTNKQIVEIYSKLMKNKELIVTHHATDSGVFFELRKKNP